MRSLVTGGCGFIGSHLVEKLLNLEHHVIVVDNLSSGRMENLADFSDNPLMTVLERDITSRSDIQDAFDGVDWVFHLAGMADIVPSVERPDAYFQSNVLGTLNVLQSSREAGVSRLVYAASSSSYGIPDKYPTPEAAPIKPQYPYALTKYMGEELVLHWSQVYALPAISLRLFNVYGPRSRTSGAYGAVFGVFLAQKLKNRPFTVVGDGQQTRDFTYVTDVVDAFISAARSHVAGEAMNVGSGQHYSINHLVELLGGDSITIAKRPGEPECTFAEITKITSLLDWKPKVSFEEGVQRMVSVIENWRDAPVWDPSSISVATKSWFEHLG